MVLACCFYTSPSQVVYALCTITLLKATVAPKSRTECLTHPTPPIPSSFVSVIPCILQLIPQSHLVYDGQDKTREKSISFLCSISGHSLKTIRIHLQWNELHFTKLSFTKILCKYTVNCKTDNWTDIWTPVHQQSGNALRLMLLHSLLVWGSEY